MLLRIRYRSTDDEVAERVISDVLPHRPHHLSAYCHLRGENRTFLIDRIENADDLETGEPIADLRRHFGLQPGAPAPLELPTFPETPQGLPAEEARKLHKADKAALFARFKVPAVAATKRRELESLFGGHCFACGAAGRRGRHRGARRRAFRFDCDGLRSGEGLHTHGGRLGLTTHSIA